MPNLELKPTVTRVVDEVYITLVRREFCAKVGHSTWTIVDSSRDFVVFGQIGGAVVGETCDEVGSEVRLIWVERVSGGT